MDIFINNSKNILMNFEDVKNPKTGAMEKQARFVGKLESINEEAKENANGTMFHNASCSFDTPSGARVTRQCIVYAKNYAHGMAVGTEYSGRATVITGDDGKQSVLLGLSHLTTAGSATLADFGLADLATANADLDKVD